MVRGEIGAYDSRLSTRSRALAISPPLGVHEALRHLCRQSAPSAHEVALAFREHPRARNLAASSINRHLATLRSFSRLARMLGLIAWHLEAPGVRPERRGQMSGPPVEDVRRLLAATSGNTEGETRDAAIVATFYCVGLRVSELCGLNLENTDLERGSTWVLGKGPRERELVPLPAPVVAAIRRYLVFRGAGPGPLFQTRNRGKARDRHKSITTLMNYIDYHDQEKTQRKLAELVAETLESERAKDGAR